MILQGNLITLNLIRPETFQHVSNWLNDAKNYAKNETSIVLVGNKSDIKEQRVIKYNDGAKYCQENSKLTYRGNPLTLYISHLHLFIYLFIF